MNRLGFGLRNGVGHNMLNGQRKFSFEVCTTYKEIEASADCRFVAFVRLFFLFPSIEIESDDSTDVASDGVNNIIRVSRLGLTDGRAPVLICSSESDNLILISMARRSGSLMRHDSTELH